MGKKRRPTPEVLVVNGKRYVYTLFRVRSTDGRGRPLVCDRIAGDMTIDVSRGDEFMTAYIPEVMLTRNWPSGQADVDRTSDGES